MIECHNTKCRHHDVHDDPESGPFCGLDKCRESVVTLKYCECCLPDYFLGSCHPVSAIPVSNTTTRQELAEALYDDWRDDEGKPQMSDAYAKSVIDRCVAPVRGQEAIHPFSHLEDQDEDSDSVYAYFEWEVTDETNG